MAQRRLTRGNRNIAWIEQHCRIPEGVDVGEPVKLRSWQRKVIRGIYDTQTRTALISFGRKNAKTTLCGFLLLLHTCGPEARPNSQLYSSAQSREQAGILFSLAAKMVRMSPTLSNVVMIRDTAKQLYCAELGTLYRALSAEASTAFGLSPVFTVHDELGQVRGPKYHLYEALETASGAHENPLSIIISTQAATDADLLSILIDDAKTGRDPLTKLFLFTSDPDADPFAVSTIKQANPAYGDFLSASEVRRQARNAEAMPSREPEYRNLILNQRVEAASPFVSRAVWERNAEAPTGFGSAEVYLGLDLSAVNDLTALTEAAPIDGVLHVRPTFWLPEDGLRDRSKADRVPYDIWHKDGSLETTPGATISYEFVARHVADLIERGNVKKAAFDRWNWKHFKPWLLKAGLSEPLVDEVFVEFGQGFASMSPALRELEALLLAGRIRHGGHPVLSMCARNAVVQMDPAGNRKLDKARSSGRIDGMVSLAMATSLAAEDLNQVAAQPEIFVL